MRRGTKIGWLLVALSIVLCIWVIVGGSSDADTTTEDGFILSDDGTQLKGYTGAGGDITIPEGVVTIDGGVFANKAEITGVVMPATVTTLGTGVFQGCTNMRTISLGASLSSIPAQTFRECTSLGEVSIPGSVSTIGSHAFYGCTSLRSVSIPAQVSEISLDAFRESSELTSISVAGGNSHYRSADGCLYNAAGSRLLLVPEGKTSISFSPGMTTIASGAFQGCSYLTNVTIPGSVTTIEADAFSGSGITTATISASVNSIGTQSGWNPTTIYGYADSATEKYAKDNNIPFIVVGNSGEGGGGDNEQTPGGDNNGDSNGDNNGETPGGDNNGNTNAGGAAPSANGAQGGAATSGGSQAAAGQAAHQKDATPTTADGFDSRYFLCLAIFLGGVGVIAYSRHNKLKYVSQKKDR